MMTKLIVRFNGYGLERGNTSIDPDLRYAAQTDSKKTRWYTFPKMQYSVGHVQDIRWRKT